MLKEETQKQPYAVEYYICKPIKELHFTPMSDELIKIFVEFSIRTEEDAQQMIKSDKDNSLWAYHALVKRIKFLLTINVDKRSLLFLTYVYNGNVGTLIMLAYYMQYICFQKNIKQVRFNEEFSKILFPLGFPDEANLHAIWEAQKVAKGNGNSDNLIDYSEAAKSINY
jgi:hypothetical protein